MTKKDLADHIKKDNNRKKGNREEKYEVIIAILLLSNQSIIAAGLKDLDSTVFSHVVFVNIVELWQKLV